jgi:hypothetical protein
MTAKNRLFTTELTICLGLLLAMPAHCEEDNDAVSLSTLLKSTPRQFDPTDPEREKFNAKLMVAFRHEIQTDSTGSWPVLLKFLKKMPGAEFREIDYKPLRKAMCEFQSLGFANATGYEKYPLRGTRKFEVAQRIPSIVIGDATQAPPPEHVTGEQRQAEFNSFSITLDMAIKYPMPTLLFYAHDDNNRFLAQLKSRVLYLAHSIRYLDASSEAGLDACIVHAAWTPSADARQLLMEQKERRLLLNRLKDREPENDIRQLDELLQLNETVVKNGLAEALLITDFKFSEYRPTEFGILVIANYDILFSEYMFEQEAAEKLFSQVLRSFSERYKKLKPEDPMRGALRARAESIYNAYCKRFSGDEDIAEKVLGQSPRHYVGGTVNPTRENPNWLEGKK